MAAPDLVASLRLAGAGLVGRAEAADRRNCSRNADQGAAGSGICRDRPAALQKESVAGRRACPSSDPPSVDPPSAGAIARLFRRLVAWLNVRLSA